MKMKFHSILAIALTLSLLTSTIGFAAAAPTPVATAKKKPLTEVPPLDDASDDTPRSVETLRDPLHPGNSLSLNFSELLRGSHTTLNAQLQAAHTFGDLFALGVMVPSVLIEKNPTGGVLAPYLGGGPYSRMFLNGLLRFWGTEISYFNLGLVVGFPFQTDPVLNNSSNNSWLIGGTATGHYRFSGVLKRFAIEGTLSDADSFSNKLLLNTGVNLFYDASNSISWVLQVFYFMNDRLDVRATYVETAPQNNDVGTDSPNTFIITHNVLPRTRAFGFGCDYALNRTNLLLTVSGSYITFINSATMGGTSWSAGVKWIF